MKYIVMKNEYPFNDILGVVNVEPQEDKEAEGASALYQAKEIYGSRITVEPATQ